MEPILLANGIRLVILPTAPSEIVAVRAFWLGGTALEAPAKQGLAHLVAAVLQKGCGSLTSQDIAGKVEAAGASLGSDVQPDCFMAGLGCLRSDFAPLLGLLAEVLQDPTFPEAELALERQNTLMAIRTQQERPATLAYNQLRAQLYGTSHPYGFLELGSPETVANLTREDLVHYHQGSCVPQRLVLCVASSLDPDLVLSQVEARFGAWTTKEPLPLPDLRFIRPPATRKHTPQATEQNTLFLGYPAVGLHDPDQAVFKLLSTYLGSGLSSRLFVELREKKGLAYDVSAFFPTRSGASHFVTYIGTAPKNLTVAEAGLRAEVERLQTSLLSADELRVAKNKLLGQYALSKQSSAQVARIQGLYEVLGLGADYDVLYQERIRAITAEQIQAVAQCYLTEPSVSLVGPEVP
ncbi:M16 family metallopeptidase [Anthocerotibacter panamensis]|uniref:M16 family metallopeptidase n=1 Tax=Anthocerotibacter panamensis TaxID=2857077 RepID=UPI001C405582|nr:pitrilysin family protein [Anthocerotibacter panamensis]